MSNITDVAILPYLKAKNIMECFDTPSNGDVSDHGRVLTHGKYNELSHPKSTGRITPSSSDETELTLFEA